LFFVGVLENAAFAPELRRQRDEQRPEREVNWDTAGDVDGRVVRFVPQRLLASAQPNKPLFTKSLRSDKVLRT